MYNARIHLPLLFALAAGCASAPPPEPLVNRASVRVDREMGRGQYRYRVEGAAGRDQQGAREQAMEAALEFAARQVTGDPQEKTAATNFVKDNLPTMRRLATPGPITSRRQVGDRFELTMYVIVKTQELERALAEAGVIKQAKQIARDVGRPTLMVVAKQDRCEEGGEGPQCTLERQIADMAANIEEAKEATYAYQDKIVEAGCVDQEKVRAMVQASGHKHAYARRSSGSYRGFYRRRYYASSASASASSSYRYHGVVDQVRNSPNCQPFVQGLRVREGRLAEYEKRLMALQDKHGRLLEGRSEVGLTRTKLDQYLVDARLDVVDSGAVEQARRTSQAMGAVSGLADDPVARLAQLAGADVYVEFEAADSTRSGGYQLELAVRAYDVVSGKLLASRVAKSRRLANPDRAEATTEAASKVMPVVLDQIQAYWSDFVREGARTKVVVRGNVGPIKRDIVRALDGVVEEIRECGMDVQCSFELGLTTGQTIEGEFVVPAKRRSRIGLAVEGILMDQGLGVEVVVSNPALTMVRVF